MYTILHFLFFQYPTEYSTKTSCLCYVLRVPEVKRNKYNQLLTCTYPHIKGYFTHTMPWPCCAHAVALPYRVAEGLYCVVPIWVTKATVNNSHMPCRAQTMPLRKRLLNAKVQHGMGVAWARRGTCELTSAVSRWPVGDLPRFGFFRLSRGHSRRLLLPFVMCLICSDDDGDSRLYVLYIFMN
jgi:hypothetical protein